MVMARTEIRFATFPRTEPPPDFIGTLVEVFRSHEQAISTRSKAKGLTSDQVLAVIRADLESVGFAVETGKSKSAKIHRPVFFGENGVPTVRYEIDAYHANWRCGLEVEAGRANSGASTAHDPATREPQAEQEEP